MVGGAVALQLAPQQLADALGIRVVRLDWSPQIWAAYVPHSHKLLLARWITGGRREHALLIASAHALTPQATEPQYAYLYGEDFEPLYHGERAEHIQRCVDGYMRSRARLTLRAINA